MNTLDEATKEHAEQAYNESSVLTWEIPLDGLTNRELIKVYQSL